MHTKQVTSNIREIIVEIRDFNVMVDGQNFFDQPVKNNFWTYNSIRQIALGQGDDNTTYCLLDYNYFKNYYKMIARNLSKQKALDTDPKSNNLTTEAAN